MPLEPEHLLTPTPKGLYCLPGDFYIDPVSKVDRAVITHGHSDHARAGHTKVLATSETLAIMAARLGPNHAASRQSLSYGERCDVGGVAVTLHPAGHILGSAQVHLDWHGLTAIVSGDYKCRPDPTCPCFEPVPAHLFVTEATFGLPVFRHPPDREEIAKLLHSMATFPEKTHLVGVYSLGKAQRLIALLRAAGYAEPIPIHGALEGLCALYERLGVRLGPLALVKNMTAADLAGRIVLCPPSTMNDRWARRAGDCVRGFASGWMGIRARARQRGVELPLIISDHADWDELTQTIEKVAREEVWVTHGREDALVHVATQQGLKARPLSLVGYGEEDGGDDHPDAGGTVSDQAVAEQEADT